MHVDNSFITLTYDQEHLPSTGSLIKKDFQDFMKRFRKAIEPIKIRYFMCGEYGEKFQRPHYHAIIFGYDFPDKTLWKTNNGFKLYRSPFLENEKDPEMWNKGHSLIGDVTFESAAYVARYITKKITGELALDHYINIDTATGEYTYRIPEYVGMSRGRKPDGGIGKRWYLKYKRDLDKDYITIRGVKMRPPKYYDKLQEEDEPFIHEQKILDRKEEMRTKDGKDNTTDRLRVREHLQIKKFQKLIRGFESDNENLLNL